MLKKSISFLALLLVFTAFASSDPINLSKSPGRASVHASVLAYGNKVMVTWREESLWDIYYTIYSNGSWSTPAPVFDTSKISKNPHLDIGPDGVIHLCWAEGGSSATRDIYHAVYKNGIWQDMEQIYQSPGNSNWCRVGIISDNTVNITWTSEISNKYDQVIRNNWKPAGGTWDPNGVIVSKKKPEHSTGHSDIYTRGNKTYCVWREGKVGDGYNIMFSQKTGSGSWTYPVKANDTGGTHSYARLAVDSKGDVHVIWENYKLVRYGSRVGGTWMPTVRINSLDGKHPNFLDIDVDPGDNLHACYVVYISDTRRDIYYNFKESGGNWVPANDVRLSTSSTPNQLPAISVDDSGAAHVIWSSAGETQPGDVMYVKVASHMNAINVTAPASGDKLRTGDTLNIQWDCVGITGNVFIRLVNQETKTSYEVAEVPYDSSPYNYVLPPEVPPGYYIARVKQKPVRGDSGIFSIVDITITSDHTGKTYGLGSYLPMEWTTSGIIGDVKANLIKTDGTVTRTLAMVPFNSSPYSFPIPADVPAGVYFVKLKQNPANDTTGDFNLVVPDITITSPAGGETFEVGTDLPIAWTTTGIEGTLKLTLWKSDNSMSYLIDSDVAHDASPYNYNIPCEVTPGTYYAKIKHGPISDKSANFTIAPNAGKTITVTRPNGGEIERAGTIQEVTWDSTGAIDNVKIEYSPDNGANWGLLIPSTSNTGSYTGLIPPETPPSDTCLLRISDVAGCSSDVSDGTFTILAALPIHVFSPTGGETYSRDGQMPIGWTTSGITGNVRINLINRANRDLVYLVGDFPHNNLLIYYTIPAGVVPGTYFIKVKQSPYSAISNDFTID